MLVLMFIHVPRARSSRSDTNTQQHHHSTRHRQCIKITPSRHSARHSDHLRGLCRPHPLGPRTPQLCCCLGASSSFRLSRSSLSDEAERGLCCSLPRAACPSREAYWRPARPRGDLQPAGAVEGITGPLPVHQARRKGVEWSRQPRSESRSSMIRMDQRSTQSEIDRALGQGTEELLVLCGEDGGRAPVGLARLHEASRARRPSCCSSTSTTSACDADREVHVHSLFQYLSRCDGHHEHVW